MDKDTVICNCYGVTTEDIENAIKNGATSFEEVQEITGVGTGCGACISTAESLVNELLRK
ncbi:MAG: (2Fe-2S)-binding protein [Ruminococcus sp.]|nr:(2Fe-2S)-binding protein [Ruminococcus sp.]MCD7800049.1 (2Fe-2S)-binding protein [Ruminococcus sp.]